MCEIYQFKYAARIIHVIQSPREYVRTSPRTAQTERADVRNTNFSNTKKGKK